MAEIRRKFTAAVAGQVVTFTPVTGLPSQPDHLTINGATVTLAANAAQMFNTLDHYEIIVRQMTKD